MEWGSRISLLDTFAIKTDMFFGRRDQGMGMAFYLSAQQAQSTTFTAASYHSFSGRDSIAVIQFDTYPDGVDNDPGDDHIGLFSAAPFIHGGANEIGQARNLPDLEDGAYHQIEIEWLPRSNRDSSILRISFDCDSVFEYQYNLIDSLFYGNDSVYFGFSGLNRFVSNYHRVCINELSSIDYLTDTVLCVGDSIQQSASRGASYLWSPTTGISSATVRDPFFFPDTTTTYTVTITDSCGDTRSDSLTITVSPVSIQINPVAPNLCALDTIPITVQVNGGFGPNYDYFWNDGWRDSTNTITPSQSGTYIVTVEDVEGCRAADTINIQVDSLPDFDLGPDSTICDGDSIILDMGAGLNYSYNWDPTGDTTQSITVDSTIFIIASLTDGNNCTRRDTISFNWISLPNVDLGNDTAICQGENVFLDAGSGWQTYSWAPTGDTTETIFADSSLTYSVSVTNANQCLGVDSITITVDTLPVVDLGVDTTICQNDTLNLDAGPHYQTYIWSGGQSSQTANFTTAGTINLVVVDSNGCQGSGSKVLSTDTLPQIDLGADTSICDQDSMFLFAKPGMFSFFWNNDSSLTADTFKIDTAGTYSIQITDSNMCMGQDTLVLSIDTLPVIDLGPDTSLCFGGQVTLDAGLGYATYTWINNGSNTNTLSVDTTNNYWVEVIDSNGCVGSDTILFQTDTLPVVNLGNDTAICIGETITFDAGANYQSYQWNNGPATQTITVDSAFIYTVSVTTQAGCPGADTIELFINPLPVVNLGPDRELCIGAAINETLDAGPGFSFYEWSTGASGTEATHRTITVNIEDIFRVTVTDANGCQNTDTIETSAVHEPQINLGPDTAYCEGDDFDFIMNTGSGFIKHVWFDLNRPPPNDTVSRSGQILLVDTAGIYVVEITELFNNRECTNRDTVEVIELPLPDIGLAGDTAYCENEIFNFTQSAISRPGYTYLWSTGATTNSINISAFGNYTISVTNDTTGCNTSETYRVLRSLLPEVDLSGDTLVCEGRTIELDAFNSGYTYRWVQNFEELDSTAVLSNNPELTVSDSGLYRVELDNGFCQYQDSTFVRYDVFPRVYLGENTTLCAGDTLFLRATFNESDVDYLWNDGSQDSIYPARFSGTYTVEVSNGCGVDITNITVNFEDCSKIWVPNAFTPNSDDDNEFFRAYSLEDFMEYRIDIFDQWGHLVYTSTEIERQWDGTSFEGVVMPIGTYVWKITYKSRYELGPEGAPTRTLTGRVNLIR